MLETAHDNSVTIIAEQQTMPLALVRGEPLLEAPTDLYIPPEALEVLLESFAGPLDLLLYLIRRQNFDILDIPIAEVTRQYMLYVEMMKNLHLELAAEYLVMAALLAEIKSRLLLPKPVNLDSEEADPRAELIRRLQEYEQMKQAAQALDALPQQERDVFVATLAWDQVPVARPLPDVKLTELLQAFRDMLQRAALVAHHHIQREPLSVRARMTRILDKLATKKFINFAEFFNLREGRSGVVVTFIAVLELIKQSLIEIVQAEPFAQLHVKAVTKSSSTADVLELQSSFD